MQGKLVKTGAGNSQEEDSEETRQQHQENMEHNVQNLVS